MSPIQEANGIRQMDMAENKLNTHFITGLANISFPMTLQTQVRME